MRMIKFRGKTYKGFWRIGSLKDDGVHTSIGRRVMDYHRPDMIDGVIIKEDYYWESDYVNSETVGQFTGLRDNQGHEIYEGDILKGIVTENTADGERSRTIIGKVEFGNGSFIVEIWNLGWFVFAAEEVEVIGNIHDNPELLKGGSR